MHDIARLHAEVLRNQVRVKSAKAGGSGTIVRSVAQPGSGQHGTFVITCHHVIEEAISVKEEWDPRVGRSRKREYRQLVGVEFFDYDNVTHGHRPLNYSADGEIVAYDASHDMALLRLRTVKAAPAVAQLPAPGSERAVVVGTPVVAVGCALLHDPILTTGMVTHMGDEIDYKDYWMSNAAIIYGNSGGAMFAELDGAYRFIGIPSRVAVVGWGQAVPHLGYFSPISRVYEFLSDQLYHFLIPGHAHSEEDCERERRERASREERRLMLEAPEPEETADSRRGSIG